MMGVGAKRALGLYRSRATRQLIDDESMRPSRPMRVWALAGIVIMTVAVGFSLYSRMR